VRNGKVTRNSISSHDPEVSIDTFYVAVLDAAAKLDPKTPPDNIDAAEKIFVVPVPQKLGIAVVKISSLAPLTTESYRQQQQRIATMYQAEEIRDLKENPFTLERLRKRLNAEYVGPERRSESAKKAG
jgi:hypothetical protein